MIRTLKKAARAIVTASGIVLLLFVALAFTDVPYLAYHRLGVGAGALKGRPDLIVVLGGGGMPSPDGLIRCYYGALAARQHPGVPVVIALPANDDGSLRQLHGMARELSQKGVASSRIAFEALGFNTHAQAGHIARRYLKRRNGTAVLVVTSPEHMYRSVKTFAKAGFRAGGLPAFEKPVDERSALDRTRGDRGRVRSLALRYNLWSYMHYELLVVREYCAIAYYRLKGWI